jgi:hypothetical protein
MLPLFLSFVLVGPGDTPSWERRLGSEDFRVRARASADLVRSGRLSLCRRLRRHPDAEVARRARFAYEDLRGKALDSMEPFPCIDAAWWTNFPSEMDMAANSRLQHYLDCYDVWRMKPLPWWGFRRATRDWASDRIDQGVPVWLIRLHHWQLHRRDDRNGFGLRAR